ncbi:MAG: M20/M25/M40 family metallo-hydrolase, partial [Acidobacteriota bacterium]|nr:M20/M25/M40 family metallo-hydrolase [Acidobacteriota bacterium]
MIRKSYLLSIPLILGLFAAIMFIDPTSPGVSAEKQVWISIDQLELETIQRELGSSAGKFDIDVVTVNAGIAIVRLNSSGLADLSIQMHKSFNKCSGYILHQSQQDAYLSVEKMLSANTAERLVDYTIDNQANVNQLIPATQEPEIRQTILDLSSYHTRRHDQPSGIDSANYVNFRWGTYAAAREDISVEFFDNSGANAPSPQPSVILTITGTTLPDEIVVIGAHQDSIRSGMVTGAAPGADDDASGIASITEVIRVILEKDFRPERTLKFMAYAAEEVGLRGSKNIAEEYNATNVNVVGVLQLDMTNFKGNAGVDIGLITDFTNAAQNQFVRDLVAEYLPTLTIQNSQCNYGCSDHASWTANGFPSSFPFEAPIGQHNGTLHTENDTISQSGNNANHAEKFSKLALAFVGELAKGSIAAAPAN